MNTWTNNPEQWYTPTVETPTDVSTSPKNPETQKLLEDTKSATDNMAGEIKTTDQIWKEADDLQDDIEKVTDADINLMRLSAPLQSKIDTASNASKSKERIKGSEMMRQYQKLWSQYLWMYLPSLPPRAKQSMTTAWATMFMEWVSQQETKTDIDETAGFMSKLFDFDTEKSGTNMLFSLFSLTQWNKDYPEFFLYANQTFGLIKDAFDQESPKLEPATLAVLNNPVEHIKRVKTLQTQHATSKTLKDLDETKKKAALDSIKSHGWSLEVTPPQLQALEEKYEVLATSYDQLKHTGFQWFLKVWKNLLDRVENNKHHLTKMSGAVSFLCSLPFVWDTFKDRLDPVFALHGGYDEYMDAAVIEKASLSGPQEALKKKLVVLYNESMSNKNTSVDANHSNLFDTQYKLNNYQGSLVKDFSFSTFVKVSSSIPKRSVANGKTYENLTLPKHIWQTLWKNYKLWNELLTDDAWKPLPWKANKCYQHALIRASYFVMQNSSLMKTIWSTKSESESPVSNTLASVYYHMIIDKWLKSYITSATEQYDVLQQNAPMLKKVQQQAQESYQSKDYYYNDIEASPWLELPRPVVYNEAMWHYERLRYQLWRKDYVFMVDYGKSENEKRGYVLDVRNKKVVWNGQVAQWKGVNANDSNSFSNENGSNLTSLGAHITAPARESNSKGTRQWLRLHGTEPWVNDNASSRGLFIHPAWSMNGSKWCMMIKPKSEMQKIYTYLEGGALSFAYHSSYKSSRSEVEYNKSGVDTSWKEVNYNDTRPSLPSFEAMLAWEAKWRLQYKEPILEAARKFGIPENLFLQLLARENYAPDGSLLTANNRTSVWQMKLPAWTDWNKILVWAWISSRGTFPGETMGDQIRVAAGYLMNRNMVGGTSNRWDAVLRYHAGSIPTSDGTVRVYAQKNTPIVAAAITATWDSSITKDTITAQQYIAGMKQYYLT